MGSIWPHGGSDHLDDLDYKMIISAGKKYKNRLGQIVSIIVIIPNVLDFPVLGFVSEGERSITMSWTADGHFLLHRKSLYDIIEEVVE